jgi:hypothetical protein
MKTKDLELLSSYLDRALGPAEMRRLEQRLQADPELRAALEALRATRDMLRQLPRRRAPRSFAPFPSSGCAASPFAALLSASAMEHGADGLPGGDLADSASHPSPTVVHRLHGCACGDGDRFGSGAAASCSLPAGDCAIAGPAGGRGRIASCHRLAADDCRPASGNSDATGRDAQRGDNARIPGPPCRRT